ncbi:MAG: hypothetical protein AB1529_07910 [Candidatus Micrarchaeota archaeon]
MITTSRYASPATRLLARTMARKAGERYVARGKKTIAQLADEARRAGDDSISVVEERGGKAAVLARITVDERGRWAWAEERLLNTTEKEQ